MTRESSLGAHDRQSRVYRTAEVVGTSPDGVDAAIEVAVRRASESLRGIDWFELKELRGHIQDGRVAHYQATVKLGFRLDDAPPR